MIENTLSARRRARFAQAHMDDLVREKVRAAMAMFESQRVPGVRYATESAVDANGSLIITWTPTAREETRV